MTFGHLSVILGEISSFIRQIDGFPYKKSPLEAITEKKPYKICVLKRKNRMCGDFMQNSTHNFKRRHTHNIFHVGCCFTIPFNNMRLTFMLSVFVHPPSQCNWAIISETSK